MREKRLRKNPTQPKLRAVQDARTEKNRAAQAGQGDAKVLAFKSYREIPECMFPLFTEAGKKAYDTVVRAKYESGKLTFGLLNTISQFAVAVDNVARTALTGKPPRTSMSVLVDRLTQKLDLDDERTIIAAPEEAPINRFANTGFSSRRRQEYQIDRRGKHKVS